MGWWGGGGGERERGREASINILTLICWTVIRKRKICEIWGCRKL